MSASIERTTTGRTILNVRFIPSLLLVFPGWKPGREARKAACWARKPQGQAPNTRRAPEGDLQTAPDELHGSNPPGGSRASPRSGRSLFHRGGRLSSGEEPFPTQKSLPNSGRALPRSKISRPTGERSFPAEKRPAPTIRALPDEDGGFPVHSVGDSSVEAREQAPEMPGLYDLLVRAGSAEEGG